MVTLLKWLAILAVILLIGLTGYAYLGDMEPEQAPQSLPVTLEDQG